MDLILISGLSGSGKSIALHTLEDIGYRCVDNLPVAMLSDFIALYKKLNYQQVAIGIDTRSLLNASELANKIHHLSKTDTKVRLIFLDSNNTILVQRYAETRRTHPFSRHQRTIEEAIQDERKLLNDINELGHKIDTSLLSTSALQQLILQFAQHHTASLMLIFQSFGFKYSLPLDADFIFDVRCLPSPYYTKNLRDYTGLKKPIIEYFANKPIAAEMIEDISHHINKWLPHFSQSGRSYLNIAIGCTGGKHRSVYVAQALFKEFSNHKPLIRHRQLLPVDIT